MTKALPALVLASLLVSPAVLAQGYQVIVHAGNPVESLDASDISDYLLKKRSKWPDGTSVAPVDLADDSKVREAFSLDVHKRSTDKITLYWQRQIFSGRDVPPPKLATDADVVSYVASHRGAIGYVSANARAAGVKKVEVVHSPEGE